jgi:chemotaxis protein histidine kinase CheA
MTDEMKELMKKLEEMMEKLDKNALENELEKMDVSNQDLEKELDRSLELFKQMEFEQKLEEAQSKMEKLAEEQNKLAEKTENKELDNEKLKEKQDELNKEFEELKKDLNELKEKDKELERPKGFDEMKEKQEEASEEMEKSSDQIEGKKNKKAAESQKSAAEKMDQMAQKMKDMQSAENEGEDMDALRQLLENLLHLSFAQEDLMESFKLVKRESPEYVKLSQQQKKLKDDAKMIEDSLFALSKRVVQLESTINKEIRAINTNMAKAIDFMQERQTPMVVSRQQYIMTSINNLALLFDEALQQMQQQAQQKPGEGSCDNPGGAGKPKPGAGSVKSMQEQLNKQLDDLKKAMEEGNKPGGKKGEKEGEGMPGGKGQGSSESFAKAAAQQAKIREQLQKMRNEMNKAGKSGVDQMSKLMEETETDLVNKRITQQTINRQKEILTRLLESEKADREREFDDKRESTEGKNNNFSNPELYFEYNKMKNQEVDLLKTTPPNFNLFYKKKVSQYFQKIKQ